MALALGVVVSLTVVLSQRLGREHHAAAQQNWQLRQALEQLQHARDLNAELLRQTQPITSIIDAPAAVPHPPGDTLLPYYSNELVWALEDLLRLLPEASTTQPLLLQSQQRALANHALAKDWIAAQTTDAPPAAATRQWTHSTACSSRPWPLAMICAPRRSCSIRICATFPPMR
ncbi:hypothetical protein AAHN93_11825 [Vandammella animalimorsus]|uniref:hypothetical protein n=1 Tax=Vandammella animalimorsus TaxID=2029117 RepID=UPI0031B9DE30